MDFSRSLVLINEIDVINAIINNEPVSIEKLFKNADDLSVEQKLNKLCEIGYKIVNSSHVENYDSLIFMFNELIPESNIGEFCIEFIKFQINNKEISIEEKIEKLTSLDYENVPKSEIKMNFLNNIISLLLSQNIIDIPKLNKYNEELKKLIDYN